MKVSYGNEPKKKEPKYPYFGWMRSDDKKSEFVVLFIGTCTGMVVKSDCKGRPLYQYSKDWVESCFKRLDNFSVTFSVP